MITEWEWYKNHAATLLDISNSYKRERDEWEERAQTPRRIKMKLVKLELWFCLRDLVKRETYRFPTDYIRTKWKRRMPNEQI